MTIDRTIAIGLIVIIILSLVFFLVVPEYNKFKQLQAELSEKRGEYAYQHDYYANIDKVYADLQSRKDDIAKIDTALTSDPNLGQTVYSLQEMANNSGLIIKNLFLSKSSGGSNDSSNKTVKEIIFSISLLGNYPSLGGFLISLENSSRIFEITSISFGSNSEPPYDFNLQIKTYSY
ncbi:MAG: type 4a pilus biogenesis protein PilO [Candidatus Staskawiczbacteria bacterium]|jgi:Tfp pilus assembly protein PilO